MFKMSDEKNVLTSQDIELKPIRSQVLGSTSSLDLHSVDSKLENLEQIFSKKTDDTEEALEETPFLDPQHTAETPQIENLTRTDDADEIELQNLNTESGTETEDKSKRSNAERFTKFLNSTRPARFRIVGLIALGIIIVSLFTLFIHKSLESVQYDKVR